MGINAGGGVIKSALFLDEDEDEPVSCVCPLSVSLKPCSPSLSTSMHSSCSESDVSKSR